MELVFRRISDLSKNITVYGLGDVAVSIVNFFLLSVYVTYFSATDYGAIGILGSIEVVAKIAFRFGLDGYEGSDHDTLRGCLLTPLGPVKSNPGHDTRLDHPLPSVPIRTIPRCPPPTIAPLPPLPALG